MNLSWLARAFNLSFDWVVSRPKRFLFACAFVFALLISALPNLKTELRIYEIKDPAFPSTERLDRMKEEFKDGNSAIFIFANRDPSSPLNYRQFCAIRSWVSRERYRNHDLKSVFSPFGFRKPTADGERLLYKPLLGVDCQTKAASLEPVRELRELLKTPWAGVMTNSAMSDLAVEFIYADLDPPGRFGKFDPNVIGKTLQNAQEQLERDTDLGLRIYLTGKAAPQFQFMKAMARDSLVNVAVIFLCIVLFRTLFGTWTSGILFVGAIGGSFAALVGGMSWFGIPLDILTSNLFLMLCVAGIEDFLFICQGQFESREDWRESYRGFLLPGFLTSVTTFIGFISLNTSDALVIQRFGTAAAIGTVIEWVVTFYVLPAICALFPQDFRFVRPERAWRPTWLVRSLTFSPNRFVRTVAVFAAIGGCLGWFFLKYEDSINENFPRGHLHRETFAYTKQTRDWEGIVQVVFPSSMSTREIKTTLNEIRGYDKVHGIESPLNIVPYYREGLKPGTANMVERELSATPALKRYISSSGETRATVYLSEFTLSALTQIAEKTDGACREKGCFPAGEGMVFAEFSGRMISTLMESFFASVLLVGGVLFLVSWHLPFWSQVKLIFTSLWGPIVMIGVMAFLEIPVNQATSLFASILVGLTGDNGIQYACASRGSSLAEGVDRRAEASIKLGLVFCVLSLSFLFLTLIPMRVLGALFFFGFALTLAGDLWLLKGFLENEAAEEATIANPGSVR